MTLNRLTTTVLTTIAIAVTSSVSTQSSSAQPDQLSATLGQLIALFDAPRAANPHANPHITPSANTKINPMSRNAVMLMPLF